MSVYTKNGDKGVTSIINEDSISKSDDRIELLGTIDELSSFIGFAKVVGGIKSAQKCNFRNCFICRG